MEPTSPSPSRGPQQQSRMDKLFALMESSTTAPGVRRLSAKQIASIVETRPEDCNLIIGRLLPMVLSPNSDIRVCSAFSIELVAKCAKIETLDYAIEERSLKNFDLEKILDEQAPLLASVGAEFEADPRVTSKMQKQNLKEVFSIAKGVEIDDMTEEIVKEEDLTAKLTDSPTSDKPMSAREKAMAKRKAKMSTSSSAKKVAVGNGITAFSITENEEEPMCKSISYLIDHLHSPIWFVRHGAILGLEAIFAGQGHTGPQGRRVSLAHSLISLLALDRFGDYNGDHMVAPVREAASAVLGLIAGDDLTDTFSVALSQLVTFQEHWQIRHAGLMGLYRLNFTNNDTITSLIQVAPSLLADSDDDVKTLTAKLLCRVIPSVKNVKLDLIFGSLLSLLEQADDLSSAVSPVLELLRLLSECGYSSDRLQTLLLPYFRSPLSIIRMQCLQTVKAMKDVDERVKRQCLQVVCLEDDSEIADLAFSTLKETTVRFPDFLPVMFTEIGSPYPIAPFHFYNIGSDEYTHTPPSHELSFKAADSMIVDPNTAARQRLQLARLFEGAFEDIMGYPKSSLFNALACLLKPAVKCKLEGDGSLRSTIFKAIYDNTDILEQARLYFQSHDLQVLLELSAELLSVILDDKDLIRLPFGSYNANAPFVKLCAFKQLDANRSHSLISQSDNKLELLFVLLNANSKVCVEECVDIVVNHLDTNTSLEHVSVVFYSLFKRFPQQAIIALLTRLLPILKDDTNNAKRLSIIKCIESMVSSQDASDVIPFAPFLLFPCLVRMSDQCAAVRQVASPVFAALVRLIPLDVALPAGMESFGGELEECRCFIGALSDPSKMLSCVAVPLSVKATLRPYQQTGYSWMLFLQRYGLHGALCDDMGLGKTLQALCCLAAYYENPSNTKKTLILCPSSLLGHWKHEAHQYTPHLNVTVYAGRPLERRKLLTSDCHLIVAPYDVFRNDQEHFAAQDYGYLVMDEAHLVKNVKSKLWWSVRELRAQHRLCLTGTPIQNHVGELWALFDILMPGYLGDQSAFSEKYGKPIQAASQANSGARDFAVAQDRLKQLHKQVLPFILRRMKEDVLTDLPPKVIQDYECELSEEQLLLYRALVEPTTSDPEAADQEHKEEQSMQKMVAFRKICIHPAMALEDPQTPSALKQQVLEVATRNGRQSMDDLGLSPKLELLRDLMVSCGIADSSGTTDATEDIASKHRMLIFAQQKRALDIVESLLLGRHFATTSYVRLDGDVPAVDRHDLVQRFNRDPSIPVMLLTTKVGGLGLNLTGADTVVFLEHDWNPMADVQAMDRAHRLGQRRVVSVYRLITKGTVEERIMGMQRWKLRVANAVVNQQNASMSTMETAGLLDLLSTNSF